MFRPWTINGVPAYHNPMRDTKIIIVLSVVATILVLGIGVCIAINPLAAIGGSPRYSRPSLSSSAPSAVYLPSLMTPTIPLKRRERPSHRMGWSAWRRGDLSRRLQHDW